MANKPSRRDLIAASGLGLLGASAPVKSVKVASGAWLDLRLRADGNRFEVLFEGRSLYTAIDAALDNPGRVALWTKADSVTSSMTSRS